MKRSFFSLSLLTLLTVMAFLLEGCATPKNIAYFQDFNESITIAQNEAQAIRLEPGDKLSIVVHSKDPSLATLFNLPIVAARTGSGSASVNGTGTRVINNSTNEGMSNYTLDAAGNIEFPVLGTLHLAGMTRSEVVGFIKGELLAKNLIKDPTIVVEFLNTGFSVMGEVKSPGRYDMNRDHINILEALTLAGDLTIQGQRQNVKVVRQTEDGQMKVYVLDLTKGKDLAASPAFYLKQNDVIYVEPNGMQKRNTTVNGNTALQASFWVSVASLLTSVAVLIFK